MEAILGLLLLFAWVQNTAITAVAWWGFADLLRAASVALFAYGTVSELISIDLANALLFTSFAVTWTGARLFDHRKAQPVLLFAVAVADRPAGNSSLVTGFNVGVCCRRRSCLLLGSGLRLARIPANLWCRAGR